MPTDPTGLTQRQHEVLDFIRRHVDEEGAPPTLQQIADALGFAQACGALKHVRRLQEAGLLDVRAGQARGIRLADRPRGRRGRPQQLELAVLGRVAAGVPIGADAGVRRHVSLDAALFSTRPDYLLHVHGDSMRDDGIFDGDLVAVKRANEARDGQIVVARLDGEITIKRLERTRTRIRLMPRNPDYAPIVVEPGADFAIEGLYCGLVRPE
jgi:repressor LexA